MSDILQVKDKQGNWVPIPALKGDRGPKGDPGERGPKGEDYTRGVVTISPTDSAVELTLEPNTLYIIGSTISHLIINIDTTDIYSSYKEYMVQFIAGTDCIVTLPNQFVWDGGKPKISPNKLYELSIVNVLAMLSQGVDIL